jgi:hypothetical protein
MEDKVNYLDTVRNKIEEANLLSSVTEEDKKLAMQLLNKKRKIETNNGWFAEFKINRINNKIEKLKIKNIKNKENMEKIKDTNNNEKTENTDNKDTNK